MAMSKSEAQRFIEREKVQEVILHHTTFAFDHILVFFASKIDLGYMRVNSEEEISEIALSDFFELFYTTDEAFLQLYSKQTLYGEASLSKHFRSAISSIVVYAIEEFMEVENLYLWNYEPDLYEQCLETAAKRYYELMSYNDLYTMNQDYPDRMQKVINYLNQ